jgi:hypothetical protein
VVAQLEHGRGGRVRDAGAHGEPAAEALRDRHHVGRHAELLVRPERARAAVAALDLIEDEEGVVLVARLTRGVQQLGFERMDARLALDRLEQDGGRALAQRGPQRADVVARHHPEARHERRERRLLRLLRGCRQRTHRAPVESTLDHHELAAIAAPAGELDRTLDRLGAGVAQEHAPAERQVGQPLRKPDAGLGIEEVADVHEASRLFPDRLHHARVAVAELRNGDAGEEVEVLVALVVPETRPLPAHELDGVARVGRHDGVALQGLKLGECHGATATASCRFPRR